MFLFFQDLPVTLPVDTHIPLWQALTALVIFAGMWAVAMYRISSSDKKHDKHFEAIRSIENSAASVAQQLTDHVKVDDERFGRIETMFAETRRDIKDILKAVGEKR